MYSVHIITTHFPRAIKLYGGLDRLLGEWVEAAYDQIIHRNLAGNLHACFQYVMNVILLFFSIC